MKHEETMFHSLLQEFLTHIYSYHDKFYIYFNTNYCTRLQHQTTCHKVGSTENTNMFLEGFHKVVKIVYLHHKHSKHCNSLLVTLIKISRNTAFDRLRKVEMDKQPQDL